MLPKSSRLQKDKDIEKVFKKGKGLKLDLLLLKTAKSDLDKVRFTFLVSKKVSKKASQRNKTKRRLRDIIRKRIDKLKPGTDNLIIALPGVEEKNSRELEENVESILLKSKLYK